MTTEAWIVVQIVLSAGITLVAGGRLLGLIQRRGHPGDGDRLVGFSLISGGAALLALLTPMPHDDDLALAVLGVKLTWVGVMTGMAYLAVLSGMEKNRHRRLIERAVRDRSKV